jgi:hypothetical protein
MQLIVDRGKKDEVLYAVAIFAIYAIYKFSFRRKQANLSLALNSLTGIKERVFNQIVHELKNDQKE